MQTIILFIFLALSDGSSSAASYQYPTLEACEKAKVVLVESAKDFVEQSGYEMDTLIVECLTENVNTLTSL